MTKAQHTGMATASPWLQRGRGAVSNATGRFESLKRVRSHDGWLGEEPTETLRTSVTEEDAKHILIKNNSPDIPFDRSINAYRGCEHGCVYCFARPTHAFLGLSPGLDFESKLFAKPNAAELLKQEISRKGYVAKPIAMGTNTDPYQPIEKERRITRELLKVLMEHDHPVTIVTKSRLVVRDLDLLAPMAEKGLVKVALSVTTLDRKLARAMEPRASTPQRRLDAIRLLSDAGVPTGVMFAPVIPALNDHEMEAVLSAAAHAGAKEAGYILLRLPLELTDLFEEWLDEHYPDRKSRVLNRLKELRGGKLNDPRFKHRMKGSGFEADLMRQRFTNLCRRLRLNTEKLELATDQFRKPVLEGGQYNLLDALR
ncbi:PA0069 family radical SAM protein [Kordiimonas lipolytica]|uniref:PA0069 family radical SAM protein n=1 Tax=Kordiimonas lipolytica TaxID=1662421 RepID=A0ABV8U977_9PROT|nr:PA0069 family radical SAM protein [Kordiimonas lipolytica]